MIDWVKMRTDLYRHPKIIRMATHLADHKTLSEVIGDQFGDTHFVVPRHVMRHATVGALVTVWGVMRHVGKRDGDDLLLHDVTMDTIDEVADMPGIGDAMCQVDWAMVIDGGSMVFPKFFADNNVDPIEKLRESSRDRSKRYRERQKNVTSPSRDANVTVTGRVEKSRVEKSTEEKRRGKARSSPSNDGSPPDSKPAKLYSSAFEAFYQRYPRKKDKRRAWKSWTRAVKMVALEKGVDTPAAEEYLQEAVEAFAQSRLGQAGKWCPYACNWLDAASYGDDRSEWERQQLDDAETPLLEGIPEGYIFGDINKQREADRLAAENEGSK